MPVVSAHQGTAPPAARLFSPIAFDLAEVDRIFAEKLAGRRRHVARLIERLAHYRGKRLRPALLLFSAQACGGIGPVHHLLGAVVEMIHTATLVHDDVLDEATLRRHARTINADHGNQASVLLGDMLFSHAFHLASTTGDARACEIIGDATNRVCEGELHQISERGNLELTEDEYLDIIDGKTAELTACCCRLGALYAGADDAVVDRMAEYGRSVGMAFQVADDLMDLTGLEKSAGKTLGTDLHQCKLTLPLLFLLERLPTPDAAELRRRIAGGNISREALEAQLHDSGAINDARRRAAQFADRARAVLADLPPSDARSALETIADWSVHRQS